MKAYERLLKYVQYPTGSDENSDTCPSTSEQTVLGMALCDEMKEIGVKNVYIDDNGYVYGEIPASEGCEDAPVVGFIAHMDVVREVPFTNIKPRIVEYGGGDVVLNEELGVVLSFHDFPEMADCIGKHIIVTDGTTLLGADDKNGIAEILTAAEELIAHPEIKHGTIKIGFTPDEEIGLGADRFDLERFGADFAYTLDGDETAISDAKGILSKKGATYRNIWFGSETEAGQFTAALFSFPTTYVVDQNGNIVGQPIMGGITSAEQKEALNKLIDQALANSAE